MGNLDGKIAVVTGASKGIGSRVAERLGRDGAVVAAHYGSDQAGAERTVATIEAEGGQAFPVAADLGQPTGPQELMDRLDKELAAYAESGGPGGGRASGTAGAAVDILVHNAAIGSSTGLEISPEEYDRLFAVNVRAPLFLTQRLEPRIRDGGRIVVVSSGAVRIAMPAILPYAMTKGAVEVLTLHLAQQLGERNVTVNAVRPGMVENARTRREMDELPGLEQYMVDVAALGRLGQPDDVAGVVGFLTSDGGRWVTGQVLDATGGAHL